MCKTPRSALPTLQRRCLPRVNLPFTLTDPVHSPFTQSLSAPFPHAPSSKGSYVLGCGGWDTKDGAHAGGCYSVGNADADHCGVRCTPAQDEGSGLDSSGRQVGGRCGSRLPPRATSATAIYRGVLSRPPSPRATSATVDWREARAGRGPPLRVRRARPRGCVRLARPRIARRTLVLGRKLSQVPRCPRRNSGPSRKDCPPGSCRNQVAAR